MNHAPEKTQGVLEALSLVTPLLSLFRDQPELLTGLLRSLETEVYRLVDDLCDDNSENAAAAADTLTAVIGIRPVEWYATTPLGRRIVVVRPGILPESVTHDAAAQLVGVSRQRIGQLVGDGRISLHDDGHADTASVLQFAQQRAATIMRE